MLQKQSATSPFFDRVKYIYIFYLFTFIYSLLFIHFYLFTFLYKSFLYSDFTIIMHNFLCYNIERFKNNIIFVKIRKKEEV